MPKAFPKPLTAEVAKPLLAAAQRVAALAPWEFMSDLELLGMRDEKNRALHVASILGTLGTIFAVIIYRNDAGLRWIHEMATHRTEPDPFVGLEDLDYIKVEWCRKSELHKSDLATLAAAGFKPQGKGPVWPRFESGQPGWYPWGLTEEEARLMAEMLDKITRFINLREVIGILHEEPIEAEVPIIPAGGESTLKAEEIEWLPFVPAPEPMPAPVLLPVQDQERLDKLPTRDKFVIEVIAPLVPELSFFDPKAGRPCLARPIFAVDRETGFAFSAHLAHGAAELGEALRPALVKILDTAKARPAVILVDNERLAAALRPLAAAITVPVEMAKLGTVYEAWEEFRAFFASQQPH